ncbi:mechanosensitive ion channel family protein [Ampullimonas aquatilis]|uniref:mechanosensitive ion channel family protein n=1 Tax=Ampullimonas aquatilis TaxID=1341549 RepID=UPI003C721C46
MNVMLPFSLNELLGEGGNGLAYLGMLVLLLGGVLLVHRLVDDIAVRITRGRVILATLVAYLRNPTRWVALLFTTQLLLRSPSVKAGWGDLVLQINTLLLIGVLSWAAIRAVAAVCDGVLNLNPVNISDNLQARRIHTQATVLARTLMFLIGFLGLSSALMTFPSVRQLGTSLLASAGVAGLIVGFAAKPVLSNMLAGLQIALTQPIRIEDVVIIENEWGWVEEINASFVIVRLWDQRRMVVPLNWFIEHPFQNWTRTSAQIIGSVFIWVDHRMPLEPLREELKRLCNIDPDWDQRVSLLQVTDATPTGMELRALVSSSSSPQCWDLRCRVREGLVRMVATQYPQFLPKVRAALREEMAGSASVEAVPKI